MVRLNSFSFLDKATLVLAVALLLCLFPLSYGFYTVIRLTVSIIAGCWAYRFYKNNKTHLAIIAAGIVILFQPLIKIALNKTTWNIIDIVLAVFLCILVLSKKRELIEE